LKIVNSITRGAEILRSLSHGIDRISDLSTKLRLSKSTIHRLLKTLEGSELVMQDPVTRRYYLGPLVLYLASKPIIAHQNLVVSAFKEMEYLRDLSKETVVLHIRIGLDRLCLEELQSSENIRYVAGKGAVAPVYTGSAGKVLLSEIRDDELELLLKSLTFVPIGPKTITNKRILLKELEKVRNQGYATSFGERLPGAASISVPIKNYICPVALSLLGPDNRFDLKAMMKVLGEMRASAYRLSVKLKGLKLTGETNERKTPYRSGSKRVPR
jgi:DNA-binding IclR family transcriptional regulator